MILLPQHTLKLLSLLSVNRIYQSSSDSEVSLYEDQVQAVRKQSQSELDSILDKTCSS